MGPLPKSRRANLSSSGTFRAITLAPCIVHYSPSDETLKFVLSSDILIIVWLIFFIFGIFMEYNRTHILVNLFELDMILNQKCDLEYL